MLDKLIILTTLCALQGPLTDVREPSRAVNEPNFTIYNATPYEIMAVNGYNDDYFIVPANTNVQLTYEYHSSNDWIIEIREDWDTLPKSFWYECLDSIGQPTYPDWNYGGEWTCYFNVKNMISTCHGLGIYLEEYIPNDQSYYIAPYTWGGISKGQSDWTSEISLLPANGMNPRIHKKDGSYVTASDIKVRRTNVDTNVNYATLIYATINGVNFNIANNFGYKDQTFTGFPSPNAETNLQPYVLYYNDWTNEITFYNTPMPKGAESNPTTGYMPCSYLVTDSNPGYLAYSEQGVEATAYALTSGFTFAYMAFTAIAPLWGYMVFPGVSIGLLICIPLLISLVFAVIKLIKKGG